MAYMRPSYVELLLLEAVSRGTPATLVTSAGY